MRVWMGVCMYVCIIRRVLLLHLNALLLVLHTPLQESQRLALGTSKNTIIIYDLKTANKLYTLDGMFTITCENYHILSTLQCAM